MENEKLEAQAQEFRLAVKKRSDRLMNYFLSAYFVVGLGLAFFYDTWLIALGTGSLSLLAYYSAKRLQPESDLYQYVLSAVLGLFMAQFIYQLHGMFEMHFFAFIGSAVLITYQNWKLQIPILAVVFLHHAAFSYLQNSGQRDIYFTQLDQFDLQTLMIHMLLTTVIFFICGLWSYQLKNTGERYLQQTIQVAGLQKEAALSEQRRQHTEILAEMNHHLEQQAKELAFSNSELEQFAYVASHDLQEPLRTISFALKLLEEKYRDKVSGKGEEFIRLAVDGAQRMKQLIADLLEFSKAGKKEDQFDQVDVNVLLAEITHSLQREMEDKKARVSVGEMPQLHSSKAAMRQVFQNLLVNALKYQPPGQSPMVNIGCAATPDEWIFSVQDNGIGIPQAHLEDIFTIFKRLHTHEAYPGTGVGLAITKKVIDYLGGGISVISEEGQGSTFSFTIPRTTS